MSEFDKACDRIAQKEAAICRDNPFQYTDYMVTLPTFRALWLILYANAVGRRIIPALPAAEQKIKAHYWDEAKKEARGRLGKEDLIELSKALFYLDIILKPYAEK